MYTLFIKCSLNKVFYTSLLAGPSWSGVSAKHKTSESQNYRESAITVLLLYTRVHNKRSEEFWSWLERYLRVSSRIPERNFHGLAQNNGVEQHSEQSRKSSSQQGILKKAERRICRRCIVRDRPLNSFERFLLVTLPHMNDMISISIHEELQNC